METYQGHVRTPTDAILLFEACRIGLLPRVQRRLSEKERQQIKSGSVFVWDEREAGMRRWTDGKSWSASRVSGSFLTYREMEGKRGGIHLPPLPQGPSASRKARERSERQSDGSKGDSDEDGPDGYRYKPDGLMKQSFSITTSNGQHLHLISYYARSHPTASNLLQPSQDNTLRHIRPPKNMYPESTVNESTGGVPAVTRGPMPGSPYAQSPHPIAMAGSPYNTPGATHPRGYGGQWPPTPNGTPPYAYAYYPHPQGPPPPGQSPLQYSHYPPHMYAQPQPQQGPTVFDRPPPPMSNNGVPPPPPHMAQIHGHPQHAQQAPHAHQYQHPQHPQHPPMAAPQHQPQYIPNPSPHANQSPHLSHQQPHVNGHGHQVDPRLGTTSAPQQPGEPAQGPHLPAINNSIGAKSNGDKAPSPHLSVSRPQNSESLSVPDSSNSGAANAPSPARNIPSVGSLLNTNPPNEVANDGRSQESTSRAGSRSPNGNVQRPVQDITGDRMNARATDQKALRKLDKMLMMR